MEDLPLRYLPKGENVVFQRGFRPAGFSAPNLHTHDHEEILLVTSPCDFTVENNGARFALRGPALILHRAGSFHEIVSVGEDRACVSPMAFFSSDLIPPGLALYREEWDLLFCQLDERDEAALTPFFDLLETAREEKSYLLQALLVRADRLAAGRKAVRHLARERYLFDLIPYLSEHYAEKNRLEDVAKVFHVSPGKLKNDFGRVTGMTVKKYLTEIRFRRAREFLSEGKSLARIAQDSGFSGESHLIAAFRKRFGCTPAQYRKRMKTPDAPAEKGN